MIIAVTGMPASGKSVFAEFAEGLGYIIFDLSSGLKEKLSLEGKEINSKSLSELAVNIRKEKGKAAVAELAYRKIKDSDKLIISGFRNIEEYDFLYTILEEIYRKTIILISNKKDWLKDVDPRVKSRLIPETIEFKAYNEEETNNILKERLRFAFVENVWEDDAFNVISNKTYSLEDIRTGLYLLREVGNIAENKSSKKMSPHHQMRARYKQVFYDLLY